MTECEQAYVMYTNNDNKWKKADKRYVVRKFVKNTYFINSFLHCVFGLSWRNALNVGANALSIFDHLTWLISQANQWFYLKASF